MLFVPEASFYESACIQNAVKVAGAICYAESPSHMKIMPFMTDRAQPPIVLVKHAITRRARLPIEVHFHSLPYGLAITCVFPVRTIAPVASVRIILQMATRSGSQAG